MTTPAPVIEVPGFSTATNTAGWGRWALQGPPGGGCTYTALALAAGAAGPTGRVGVIDTTGRAASYADRFSFDILPMTDFDPLDLIGALASAADADLACLVIATYSSFWSGSRGLLEQVDAVSATARDRNAGWVEWRDTERAMLAALAGFGGHLLITLHTKIEYAVVRDEGTGLVGPVPVGTEPDQRKGVTYDYDTVLAMADGGRATVVKSNLPDLQGAIITRPGAELGAELAAHATTGVGELVRPAEVRDWAAKTDRTYPELMARGRELAATRAAGARVLVDAEPLRRLKTGEDNEQIIRHYRKCPLMPVTLLAWLRLQGSLRQAEANGRQPIPTPL